MPTGSNGPCSACELDKRPYILVGLAALGATSNRWSMRRLGKRWKPLHKLSYPILELILLHFLWGDTPTSGSERCT